MFEYNSSLIVLHITRAEISAPSLLIKDLIEIKTAYNLPFTYKLHLILQKFHKRFNIIPTYLQSFQSFIDTVSYYEIDSIAYTYTLNTFDMILSDISTDRVIKCPYCDKVFRKEISVREFVDIKSFKIWDKQIPYLQYDFEYETKLSDNTNIKFIFYIPNISTFLRKIRGISNEVINENIGRYNSILDPITELTLHTKYIVINDITLNTPAEIIEFYQNLPLTIYNNIYQYYINNIQVYKPKYHYTLNCINCSKQISLHLSPLLEFIDISTNKSTNKKDIIDDYLDMYEVLQITSERNFHDFEMFLNLPYPVYHKLREKQFDSYKQIMELKKKSFGNIKSGIKHTGFGI